MKSMIFFAGKKIPGILFGFMLLVFISGCQKESLESWNMSSPEPVSISPTAANSDNYMVITQSEDLPSGIEKQISAYGKIIRSIPQIGVLVVKPAVPDFESKVANLTGVLAVVPDLLAKMIEPDKYVTRWAEKKKPFKESALLSIGNDEPYFKYLWGMDAINTPEAWNAGYTGNGSKVFILDSGIDAEHPDLEPNINKSLCTSFVPNEGYNVRQGTFFSHGSHVAGIIAAANNSIGVIGVAPDAEIIAVKVLSEYTGSGAFSWINAGIVYAANNDADVINMSLGAWFDRNGFYYDEDNILQKIPAVYIQYIILAQQRAINYAVKKGATVIVAAGNESFNADGNKSTIIVPADLQNVIAVSATAPDYWYSTWQNGMPDPDFQLFDIPASYTNFGRSLIGVAAPGGDFDFEPLVNYHYDMVLSCGSGGYYWAAGTSMSAPFVSGVAALIISKNNGVLSPLDVKQQLFNTADIIDQVGTSAYFGKGRVNSYRAVIE